MLAQASHVRILGDVRSYARDNNSARGLGDAAQNIALSSILESKETMEITVYLTS